MKSLIYQMIVPLCICITLTAPAFSMDLNEFIQVVEKKHHGLQSIGASTDAVEDLRVEGDLELTPNLQLAANYTDDKRAPNQYAQFGGYETKTTAYTASLSKKFLAVLWWV